MGSAEPLSESMKLRVRFVDNPVTATYTANGVDPVLGVAPQVIEWGESRHQKLRNAGEIMLFTVIHYLPEEIATSIAVSFRWGGIMSYVQVVFVEIGNPEATSVALHSGVFL